jgi:hypothetical protein
MPNRSLPLLASLLVALLGLACASDGIDVSTTYDPLVRFPRQALYVWDDAANKTPDDSRLDPAEIDSIVKEAANAELAARGYRLATGDAANYRLSYDLTVHTWLGPDNSRSLGSLSLWLADAASKRRVWMGYVRAELHVGLSRPERVARLREALKKLLEKFPPTQRGED